MKEILYQESGNHMEHLTIYRDDSGVVFSLEVSKDFEDSYDLSPDDSEEEILFRKFLKNPYSYLKDSCWSKLARTVIRATDKLDYYEMILKGEITRIKL